MYANEIIMISVIGIEGLSVGFDLVLAHILRYQEKSVLQNPRGGAGFHYPAHGLRPVL